MARMTAAQQAELDKISGAGLLSGLPSSVLEGIYAAEAPASGPLGVNSSGYGGYYGLGAGTPYPGGYQLSAADLKNPSGASFAAQTEAAAAEFQSLLGRSGGNVYAAESAYQGGGSEGTSIFSQLGVPAHLSPSGITPASTAYAQNAGLGVGQFPDFAGGGVQAPVLGTSFTPAATDLGSWSWTIPNPLDGGVTHLTLWTIKKSSVLRIGLGLVGVILLFIGLHAMAQAKPGQGPITVVAQGTRAAKDHAEKRVGDGFKMGAAAAE